MVWPSSCRSPRISHKAMRLCGSRPGGRLVEEQDLRTMHDRPRHHQPLCHTAGQRHDVGVGSLDESHTLHQLAGEGLRFLGAHPEVAAVELEVLENGHGTIERVGLRDDADELLGQSRLGDDVDTADHDRAAGRDDSGGEHADGRALAGAIGPEQSVDLAGVDLQVDVVDGQHVAAHPTRRSSWSTPRHE